MPPDSRRDTFINKRIVETMVDLVLIVDRQGHIERVSPSSYDLLGYLPWEMIGHSAKDFLYHEDLEATRTQMRLLRQGATMRHFECRYTHKNGNPVMLAWTGVWVAEDDRFFFIGRDVSASKVSEQISQMEMLLNQVQSNLQKVRYIHLIQVAHVAIFEVMLTISSCWAAYVLLVPPPLFVETSPAYWLASAIFPEYSYGLFALVAALVKMLGMAISVADYQPTAGRWIRCVGLAMSGVFWTIMGVSAIYGAATSTLFGVTGLLMGIFALWSALRVMK